MSIILGISAFYHDSASCLIEDGIIVSAAQEERFTRNKHDDAFPLNAIKSCLKIANKTASDIDFVVFYEKPFLKFERIIESYLSIAPRGILSFLKVMPIWSGNKIFQKAEIIRQLRSISGKINWEAKLRFSEHHLSHAASAFFLSPYSSAAVVVADGVGEWTTTSIYRATGQKLEKLKSINYPHSLGMFYSSFTYFCGFKVNSGEYKLMGLAPYGTPRFKNLILEEIIQVNDDGSFKLNMKYFGFLNSFRMTNKKFSKLFGCPQRQFESPLEQIYLDIAASAQAVLEDVYAKIVAHAILLTGNSNVCLAGGVALNCVANGKIYNGISENLWIQPASGDAGGALGAALAFQFLSGEINECNKIMPAHLNHVSLGPQYSDDETKVIFKELNANFIELSEEEILHKTAQLIGDGKTIGWVQGKMEFGPRALGNRSILADPRSKHMQRELNLKVKFRESFRPFAPAILEEDVTDWFNFSATSPFMLIVTETRGYEAFESFGEGGIDTNALILKRLSQTSSPLPAVTHVNGSARIQTVSRKNNLKFWKLLKEFKKQTGCPVLINTSFNIRGEPIVESPMDAYNCFMGSKLDFLVVGNLLLDKTQQPGKNVNEYRDKFQLD